MSCDSVMEKKVVMETTERPIYKSWYFIVRSDTFSMEFTWNLWRDINSRWIVKGLPVVVFCYTFSGFLSLFETPTSHHVMLPPRGVNMSRKNVFIPGRQTWIKHSCGYRCQYFPIDQTLKVHFTFIQILSPSLRRFLPIWHKCTLGLKDKLVRFCWLQVKLNLTLPNNLFAFYSTHLYENYDKILTQESNRIKWWHSVSQRYHRLHIISNYIHTDQEKRGPFQQISNMQHEIFFSSRLILTS